MDKGAIKNFAIEARKILMKSAITEAGFYGVAKDGCNKPIQKGNDFEVYETLAGTENRIYGNDIIRRANLVKAVQEQGFDQVIEETAYTWFNRIIAIRFMEVNDYLPTRVRVLSSETGSNTPDIVTQSLDVDLNMTPEELEKVQTAKANNKYDEAFRLLFIKQCNELNDILPGLFEKTDDYMELLLKLSYINDGVVRMLVDTIPDENFDVEKEGQVEIIGWMYQYYNTELKKETYDLLNEEVKVTKERIPSVTQLFTPDWIVRYLVENSVGRIWIDHLFLINPSLDKAKLAKDFDWIYYTPNTEQCNKVITKLKEKESIYTIIKPTDITCLDPCMGSGHILVYIFDVLMDIYRSEGYNERDAVYSILENNIFGLDIDKRAYQLTYFALAMKARSYDRRFFKNISEGYEPNINVYVVEESNSIKKEHIKYIGNVFNNEKKIEASNQLLLLLQDFRNAKEIGSLVYIREYDWKLLTQFIKATDDIGQISFDILNIEDTKKQLLKLIQIGEVISKKYDVVSTNPPYMGINNMGGIFYDFVVNHYSDFKHDVSCVFIERSRQFLKKYGYEAMITQQSFMFNSRYYKARKSFISHFYCENLLHLGSRAFDEISGEKVQTCAFVFGNEHFPEYESIFIDLQEENSEEKKKQKFLKTNDRLCMNQYSDNIYKEKMANFLKISKYNFSYWLSEKVIEILNNKSLISSYSETRHGLVTGKGEKFMRFWSEVDNSKLITDCDKTSNIKMIYKWFPYNKGGTYRKWYGNREYVINWENNGNEIQNYRDEKGKIKSSNYNLEYNLLPNVTWSDLSTGKFSARFTPQGALFDTSGPALFCNDENHRMYILAFMNSLVMQKLLDIFCTGLHYSSGSVGNIPLIIEKKFFNEVINLANENIILAKEDWDSFEMSWEFTRHPLVRDYASIEDAFQEWSNECNKRFMYVKKNEIRLNEIFIAIYGLENEMTSALNDEDITIRKADIRRDIKGFISYAVGCMFGRYSLDKEGLAFAGGNWNSERYIKFVANLDGVIPITDEDYLKDDIVARFVDFVKVVFGNDNLEQNLDYIAYAIGKKGSSARDILRSYFISDFFSDHCNMYSLATSGKRPIYWLFDSGKQNGFKALIYMHRYNKDTVGVIRSKYLIRTQEAIQRALQNAEYVISSTTSAVDRAKATKARDKYIKQLNEMKTYYQALSHVALQRIEIDLDDGVKANYAKFQGIEVSNEETRNQTIDLLAII